MVVSSREEFVKGKTYFKKWKVNDAEHLPEHCAYYCIRGTDHFTNISHFLKELFDRIEYKRPYIYPKFHLLQYQSCHNQ